MMKAFFSIALILCASNSLIAQGVKPVQLKQEHIAYAPANFYISDVVDDRADKASIGSMKSSGKTEKLDMQGGAAGAIKGFIAKNVSRNKATQAIVLHITALDFDIKKANGQWNENAELVLTYYAGERKLVELSGKGEKQTEDDPLSYVDEFFKKSFESDLKRFDTWWGQNKDRVPTASEVKVIPQLGRKMDKPDRIIYSLNRPLSIQDFQAEPEGNIMELAATLSGIGMESTGKTQNGQIVITVNITPYFSKSGSWFKKEGKNSRVLAHEQTHFDITAIKACELINKIRNMTFTQDNYENLLQEMMRQNQDAANKEEALFDDETNHGIIKEKEEEWEAKVKEKIRQLGCY